MKTTRSATVVLLIVLCLWAPAQDANRFPGLPAQDAIAYDLDLHVDPVARKVDGRVGYRIRAVEALTTVKLHARRGEGWSVSFMASDGAALKTSWKEGLATITLDKPAAAGEEIRFAARLVGTPPDGFYFKESRYGDALAFTDHYSIRARGWLPCEDHPGDRAAFRLNLSIPEGYDAVASGARVESTPAPGERPRQRWVTRSDIPPYMFAICVGPYAKVAEGGDPRLQPHFVYAQDVGRASKSLVHHGKWMKIMESTFGPYPYGKYTTIQCPTRWGGFEAPGNVQLSERLFDGRDGGVGTLAHEFVHMWFGDGIGYAEWKEVWLSEGFASYFGPWLNAQTGGPTLTTTMNRLRDRWRRSRDGLVKSIRWGGFAHPDEALNANTYPKGAWVLHMLRAELGDKLFFEAMRRWCARATGTSVLTTDFVAAIEASTQRELSWFFDQWLDRVDCPHVKVTIAEDQMTVEQTQKGQPYRFLLPLAVTGDDGKVKKVVHRIKDRKTVLPAGGATAVLIDPDTELLFRPSR